VCSAQRVFRLSVMHQICSDSHVNPPHVAAETDEIKAARKLVVGVLPGDPRTTVGYTPLHVASQAGSVEVARLLLEDAGADVDERTHDGMTALHLAVENRQFAMTTLLLQKGAAANTKNRDGHTPLHLAAINHGPPELLFSLLVHGASVDAACSRGFTPLDVAVLHQAPAASIEALLYTDAAIDGETLLEMLTAQRANARLAHVPTGVGLGEAREEAYATALCAFSGGGGQGGRQMRLAALHRLGAAQARFCMNAAKRTFRLVWHLQAAPKCGESEYVADKVNLALTGKAVDEDSVTVSGLGDLCVVELEKPEAIAKAVALWRSQGVVVFPALLDTSVVETLRAHVVQVCAGGDSASGDQTANIRKPGQRTLRAVGVQERPEALEAISEKLARFLNSALGDSEHLLLEQAAYRIQPGAVAQEWHLDDSIIDSRIATLQVTLVHTVAEQGAFQVQPGTHRRSTLESYLMWAHPAPPLPPQITIAVPEGSVMCYSPNVVHRGGANTHSLERLVVALTLMSRQSVESTGYSATRQENGIPLAIQPQDQGQWWLGEGGLVRKADIRKL